MLFVTYEKESNSQLTKTTDAFHVPKQSHPHFITTHSMWGIINSAMLLFRVKKFCASYLCQQNILATKNSRSMVWACIHHHSHTLLQPAWKSVFTWRGIHLTGDWNRTPRCWQPEWGVAGWAQDLIFSWEMENSSTISNISFNITMLILYIVGASVSKPYTSLFNCDFSYIYILLSGVRRSVYPWCCNLTR